MSQPLTSPSTPHDCNPVILGHTLPALLDWACDRRPNPTALNQWQRSQWQPLSSHEIRLQAEEIALGLLDLGLTRGDRVALVMHSDVPFCLVDLGCLLAGLVDVPIDLTQTIENIVWILRHSQVQALVVSNVDLLYQLMPHLWETETLRWVIVAEVPPDWETVRTQLTHSSTEGWLEEEATPPVCLHVPQFLCAAQESVPCPPPPFPSCLQLVTVAQVQRAGKQAWSVAAVAGLRRAIAPGDLATILYIASETTRPKGVMLSHENISANVLAAFSSYPNLQTGAAEVALLFLPLTHIFARVFLYGHLAYGHSLYLSDPNHVVKHLKRVQPTVMITVPRLLEKIHERILETGKRLGRFDQAVLQWALHLVRRFDPQSSPKGLYAWQLAVADRLVLAKWRSIFGGRLKACISGGAMLRAEVAQFFSAAGVPIVQGYGLTETSGVVTYNRGSHQRLGTVGIPIPGVELALAEDGEVLIKAPFVMQGYDRDPTATQQVLDANRWLHTGDLGEIGPDGSLTLTGVKKSLFKLTTGKYVSPLPLEMELLRSHLVSHALTVGVNHKFCGMLIFPNLAALRVGAEEWGLDTRSERWFHHPRFHALYQQLIDTANCHLPYWSTVRRFALIAADLTVENGLLHPDGQLDRPAVMARFAPEIEALYSAEQRSESVTATPLLASTPNPKLLSGTSAPACPLYAQSLVHN